MIYLWGFYEIPMKYLEIPMRYLINTYEVFIKYLWVIYEIPLRYLWYTYEVSMKYIKGINEIPTHGHGFFKILFYKKFEKMEIQNWELIDKLFLTISIDYSELDAVLRAQKIKTKTNGAVISVGGQTVSQFDSSRVLSDVVTYLSATVKTTLVPYGRLNTLKR